MCAWHVAFPPVLVAVPCGRKRAQAMGTRDTALITTSFPNQNGSVADATQARPGFNVQAHAVNTPPLQYYEGIVASEVKQGWDQGWGAERASKLNSCFGSHIIASRERSTEVWWAEAKC